MIQLPLPSALLPVAAVPCPAAASALLGLVDAKPIDIERVCGLPSPPARSS